MLRKSHLFFFLIAIAVGLTVLAASGLPKIASADAARTSGTISAGGVKVVMNGIVVHPYSPPFIDDGTVYLPVRDMGKLLGTSVSWNAAAKTVAMYYPEITVELVYGAMNATVNGKSVALTAPLRIVDSRVYVPLRFFSEATGADVKWDASTRTTSITRADDFIRAYASGVLWLNRKTGDLYRAEDDQSMGVRVGRLDVELQGEVTLQGSWNQKGNTVLTVIDHYGKTTDHYDAYGFLLHDGQVSAQTKASYTSYYESNGTSLPVYDPTGWIQYALLTDGKIISAYNDQGQVVKTYDLPRLAGEDDVYFVQAIGDDYLVARPNQTGLLTLIDLKDNSVVVLADKLLTGKDLADAHSDKMPAHIDGLHYSGDAQNGLLFFNYENPAGSANGNPIRLTYERPSYQKERDALPHPRTLSEMAAGCSADTIETVSFQEGDQLYVPLVGTDKEDRNGITVACGILKKFASKGTEETLPAYFLDTFYHGMSIEFKTGDSVSMFEAGGDKLAIGAGEGGKTIVLNDADAVRDFERLKVLLTELAALA